MGNDRTCILRYPRVVLFASLLLLCVGCVEQSIVFKIHRDGSAVIHYRLFQKASPLNDKERPLPDRERLEQFASTLAPGAKLTTLQHATSSKGWPGTEIIIDVPDINGVSFDWLEWCKAFQAENPSIPDAPSDVLRSTFHFASGELKVSNEYSLASANPSDPGRATDPFADTSQAPTGLQAAAINLILEDLHAGIFIEMEAPIVETTALYPVKNQHLVTLVMLDGNKLDLGKFYSLPGGGVRPINRETVKEWADAQEGVSVDTQAEIRIKCDP